MMHLGDEPILQKPINYKDEGLRTYSNRENISQITPTLELQQYRPEPSLSPGLTSTDYHQLTPLWGLSFSMSTTTVLPLDKWIDSTRWWEGHHQGGKVLCIPQGAILFSKWFAFLWYAVCDFSTRKVQGKRNETECREFLKIKQKSRGSGSLSQVSH